ncbi:MAG: pantoate--beta-alanine ligase [Endomicrobium sp.]|jgi:pantoate--beta-alanine ligase|uniref:pantoate--beta-alanine ligase n=1 Tax=Candidatus Endomicrobiellum cubanum TaxID=3242325 RepID=UPI002824889B|nr:pantoate--beta-alanine ligase [Endomicrobium sp.]
MKVIKTISKLQKAAFKHLKNGDEIGLVPTMGALHQGHESLILKSKKNDDVTIVSIFVNPLQFGPNEDYLKYPRPIKKDLQFCKKNHVDYVFMPTVNEMFPNSHKTFVEVRDLQDIMCGKFRPAHFRGVATVVAKLLNISYACNTYFGMKDFQQLKIIEQMVKDLNFKTKIVSCPIVREKSGLAISSRNTYLSPQEKEMASKIYKILKKASIDFKNKNLSALKQTALNKLNKIPKIKIDYVDIVNFKDLSFADKNTKKVILAVAVWLGKTRLIDNIIMTR